MLRIGIIGAAGQVGSEFPKHKGRAQFKLWSHQQLEVCEADAVSKALADADLDAVVNMAAFHNTNAAEEDPVKAYEVNAVGAYNVARACADAGIKVVFISTDYVFGLEPERKSPYLESDPVGPINVYGSSKVAGEQMTRALTPNHLIVRTSSLFGVTTSKKGWTFPEMIAQRAQANEPLKVVEDQIMSPTYTADLVKRTLELLEKDATGTVHVCNSGACSWHGLATKTLELVDIEHPVEPCSTSAFPSPARRPAYSAMDSERFEEFGLKPLRPWEEALQNYLKEKGWLG